jgi:uncharacterized membrane protein YidH (DUF202 family)
MTQRDDARTQTALAWGRTSLGAGGLGVAMLRVGAVHHSTTDLVAAVGLLVCGLLLAVHGRRLYRADAAGAPFGTLPAAALAAVLTGVVVAVADLG